MVQPTERPGAQTNLEPRIAALEANAQHFATKEWVLRETSRRWQTWVPIAISLIAVALMVARIFFSSTDG